MKFTEIQEYINIWIQEYRNLYTSGVCRNIYTPGYRNTRIKIHLDTGIKEYINTWIQEYRNIYTYIPEYRNTGIY